jgi:hypothetical protein
VRRAVLLAAVVAVSVFASGAERRVTRTDLANMEKIVNSQLAGMFPDEPWLMLGYTRGVYVPGVGAVFSAEVNLATGPTVSPFSPNPAKEAIAAHRQKKLARVPKLRETMYAIVKDLGNFMTAVPADEQIVFAVTLLRYPYETGNDVPTQIVMHIQRAKLADALAKNVPLKTAIVSEDY